MPPKSRKNNHGSAKSLDHHLVSKNDSNRSKTSHPSTSTQNSSSEEIDSPYKNFLGKVKHTSLKSDSDDDFKTPVKSIRKVMKQVQSKKRKTNLKKSNQTIPNLILKRTRDNFNNLDVNPEHLQMALALSKSTYAEEYPEINKETPEQDLPSFLSPKQIPKITTFLEKYGFKSSRQKFQTERGYSEEARKIKSSKFRFITPVLYIRNEEERKQLINSKVAIILNQNNETLLDKMKEIDENVNSSILSEYVHDKKCWKASDLNELNSYVCHSLQIPYVKSAVGCLLKNWSEIPGREESPTRTKKCEEIDLQKEKGKIDKVGGATKCEFDGITDLETRKSIEPEEKKLCTNSNIHEDLQKELDEVEVTIIHEFDDITDSITNQSVDKETEEVDLYTNSKIYETINLQKELDEVEETVISDTFNELTNSTAKVELKTDKENVDNENIFVEEKEQFGVIQNIASCSKVTEERIDQCSSPDLFSSEDELDMYKLSPVNQLTENTNKGLEISKLPHFNKESKNGKSDKNEHTSRTEKSFEYNRIEHYESSFEDITEIEEIIDLTQNSDDDIKNPRENSEKRSNNIKSHRMDLSGRNLEINPKKSFGTKYSSLDSGNASYEYNSTKSLNVTDYVMEFLNSQDDGDDQNNLDFLSQSQNNASSQESMILSEDEELNYSNKVSANNEKTLFHLENTYQNDTCSNKEHDAALAEKAEDNPDILSQSSIESIIVLSDEELNYSNRISANHKKNIFDLTNFDNTVNDDPDTDYKNEELDAIHAELTNKYKPKQVHQNEANSDSSKGSTITTLVESHTNDFTPEKIDNNIENISTPNENIIIKTNDVTPMPDFDTMDTPNVIAELDKFGIKPLKRRRGIQLLRHIYDSMHPYVNLDNGTTSYEGEDRRIKKRKLTNEFEINNRENIKIVGTAIIESENDGDLIFERKCSKKIASCCIPLQIAWFNFLSCNPMLAESIVLYEPIQLEVIHSMLKEQSGCNFHIQDIITFFDKKCITFRTNQWQVNNKKIKEMK
ncbi:structure-specific endonuclease subunit SLX4-like isoform X1 [Diorhabda carinulata]|uniref:structure-specific endonuclease subunit SLX4-like isoform X1 n=1 Tax=Diorhabda carinulata TaxID=1163345 RepID=UPI0025A00218|nr:structure-specific endonuclease subunit SLX4-like isoform X1 [Diorhabda carinulata]